MKFAVVGGVNSTEVLVDTLADFDVKDVKIWGYAPTDALSVSGWCDLSIAAKKFAYAFEPFKRVVECKESLNEFSPDVLFVVGLSQIVPNDILKIAKFASVGFHPTKLPSGRGRAAIAWLILNREDGAATFFELREGVDDGPIFVQEKFELQEQDDAAIVEEKLLAAEKKALHAWLPSLLKKDFSAVEQDVSGATWYGKREPDDGVINWEHSVDDVVRQIRASAPPHPGAHSFFEDVKVKLLNVQRTTRPIKGVCGRIVDVAKSGTFLVMAGNGPVEILDWTAEKGWVPKVGMLLGYHCHNEIYRLQRRVADLEARLTDLTTMLQG